MSVSIRLRRTGTNKRPTYRVVVADRAKVQAWIAKGAQPSNTVRRLLANVKAE